MCWRTSCSQCHGGRAQWKLLRPRHGEWAAYFEIYDPLATIPVTGTNGTVNRQPFAGNIIPASRINPVAAALMNYYPLPNTTPTSSLTNANNYVANTTAKDAENMWTVKTDDNLAIPGISFVRYTQSGQGGGAVCSAIACVFHLPDAGQPGGILFPPGGGLPVHHPKNAVVGYTDTLSADTILDLNTPSTGSFWIVFRNPEGSVLPVLDCPKASPSSVYYPQFPAITIANYQTLAPLPMGTCYAAPT